MGERDHLKAGLIAQFAFLHADLGFRGPKVTDRSLLLELLYRSKAFDLEIYAELRDWFLDFKLRRHEPAPADSSGRRWIRSYDLIKPYFTEAETILFNKAAGATRAPMPRGSVPAMLDAAGYLAQVLQSLVPRLLADPVQIFTVPGAARPY